MASFFLKNILDVKEVHKTDKIRVESSETGEWITFTEGKVTDAEVALDMAEGDQVITAPDGYSYKNITIPKPETLIPSNIAKDVDIGGVVGAFEGGGGVQLEGDFLNYVVYQLDDENKEIVIYAILWAQLYADTGSYDVNIPSTFGAYQVVIASEGVS